MILTAGGVPGAFEAMSAALAFASVMTSEPAGDTPVSAVRTTISAARQFFISMGYTSMGGRSGTGTGCESPKNELAVHARGSLESPQHAGVRPVLSGRSGLRDLRGAVDATDPPRALSREPAVLGDPARAAAHLTGAAHAASAPSGGRGRDPERARGARPRLPADRGRRGVPRGDRRARRLGSAVGPRARLGGPSRRVLAPVEHPSPARRRSAS